MQYLNHLKTIFRRNQRIDVEFNDFTIKRHPTKTGIYGVSVKSKLTKSDYVLRRGISISVVGFFGSRRHPGYTCARGSPAWWMNTRRYPNRRYLISEVLIWNDG